MTARTDAQTSMRNARIAGLAFLFYIFIGIQRAPTIRIGAIFTLLMCFSALVLAVTLYAITREQDQEIAMLGLVCRVGEGVLGAIFISFRLGLMSLHEEAATPVNLSLLDALDTFLASARGWNPTISAIFFAVGSTFFCWLLLRGRLIPTWLAWLGVLASILLVIGLPLQIADAIDGPLTQFMWLPMLAFEVPLALWLLIKGVAKSAPGMTRTDTAA